MAIDLPPDRAGREQLVSALRTDIEARVAADLRAVQPRVRPGTKRIAGDPKLFTACLRILRFADHAIAVIKEHGYDEWRLPLLSWLGLEDVAWIDAAERERYTALAYSDQGALWWARAFDVAPWNAAATLAWSDFIAAPPPRGTWTMFLWPFVPTAQHHGRTPELWIIGTTGPGAWPGTGWPYTIELRLHAADRQPGGSTQGAIPTGGTTIWLVPGGDKIPGQVQLNRGYTRDVDAVLNAPAPFAVEPDVTAPVAVETLCVSTPAIDAAILLATYLARANVLSPGKGRGHERLVNHRRALLISRLAALSPNPDRGIDEAQLAHVERRLDRFAHPARSTSLERYLALSSRRVLPTQTKPSAFTDETVSLSSDDHAWDGDELP